MSKNQNLKRIIILVLMALAVCLGICATFYVGLDNLFITGSSHIAANSAISIVFLVMYFSLTSRMYERQRSLSIFSWLIVAVVACCTVDSMAWLMNQMYPDVIAWEYVKAGVVVASHIISILFVLFLKEIVGNITKRNELFFKVLIIVLLIYFVFLICFIVFDDYFTIVDGRLHCDNVNMAVLMTINLIINLIVAWILLNSSASKKWRGVAFYNVFASLMGLIVCFFFDSPMIVHTVFATVITFAYCTVFTEIGGENKILNQSFANYLEFGAAVANNGQEEGFEDSKVAIVVCQIHNMKNLSNYFEPDIVIDIYNTFLEKVNQIASAYKGILLQPIGFEIKCIFNYGASVSNSYVYDAIQAAKDILSATETLNDYNRSKKYPSVYVGIAIDEGETCLGKVGGLGHLQYTVSGELVNNCYIIETNCSEGEILVSENVVSATGDKIHTTDSRMVKLPHSDEHIVAYRLGF